LPAQGQAGQLCRTIYFDTEVKGFGLLVTERGVKTFVLKYRAGVGRAAPTRRVTIGRYGSPWTVEQARGEAKRLMSEVVRGRDPAAERAAKRRGVDETRTVTAVTERWLQRDQARNRTVEEVRRIIMCPTGTADQFSTNILPRITRSMRRGPPSLSRH
jgi:hypothetical protein